MTNRLVERCAIEFERYVAKLHNEVLSTRSGVARAVIPTAPYEIEYRQSDIPLLTREVRRAYEARAMFALQAPSWCQPLPLGGECTGLLRARGAMHVLGCYSFSLELMSHDYFGHPQFYNFACGMMARPAAPEHVRDDPELQAEFPAKELPGLSGRMIWFGESLPPGERLQALDHRLLSA